MEIDIPGPFTLDDLAYELERRIKEWEKMRDKPYIKVTRREAIQRKIDTLTMMKDALGWELKAAKYNP